MGIEYGKPATYYAVQVPGLGYFNSYGTQLTQEPTSASFEELDHVLKHLESCRSVYARLGVPEIGATARVVEYAVTLTRTECQPLSPGSSSGTTE